MFYYCKKINAIQHFCWQLVLIIKLKLKVKIKIENSLFILNRQPVKPNQDGCNILILWAIS